MTPLQPSNVLDTMLRACTPEASTPPALLPFVFLKWNPSILTVEIGSSILAEIWSPEPLPPQSIVAPTPRPLRERLFVITPAYSPPSVQSLNYPASGLYQILEMAVVQPYL